MSSSIKFISNTKGAGDWCLVVLDGEVVKSGHSLSFYDMYELMKYYGSFAEHVSYIELTDEQIEEWREYT